MKYKTTKPDLRNIRRLANAFVDLQLDDINRYLKTKDPDLDLNTLLSEILKTKPEPDPITLFNQNPNHLKDYMIELNDPITSDHMKSQINSVEKDAEQSLIFILSADRKLKITPEYQIFTEEKS